MKVNIKMVKDMAGESIFLLMEVDMKGPSTKELKKGMELIFSVIRIMKEIFIHMSNEMIICKINLNFIFTFRLSHK